MRLALLDTSDKIRNRGEVLLKTKKSKIKFLPNEKWCTKGWAPKVPPPLHVGRLEVASIFSLLGRKHILNFFVFNRNSPQFRILADVSTMASLASPLHYQCEFLRFLDFRKGQNAPGINTCPESYESQHRWTQENRIKRSKVRK